MKILILFISVAFPVFFALRNSEQLKELNATVDYQRKKHNRRWHQYQFVLQGLFALAVALTQEGWFFMLMGFFMAAFMFWLVFDVVVNRLSDRPGLYLSDYGIDKILQRIGEIPTLVLKVILLIIATTWFFKNPFV